MVSTFFGLEISRRAMESQQMALDVAGHNISNANTQGYTRQIANLQATTPYTIGAQGHNLTLGTGVTVENVTRARDVFVDQQYRQESATQSYWGARENTLNQIQNVFNEPSDDSLSSDLTNFWNAWSDLSKDPQNSGSRSVVEERALTLTDSFHNIAQQITDTQNNLDDNVRLQIKQINTYAQQISELNVQIKSAQVAGDSPNDLMDQRDNLVDQLSQIVNVKVVQSPDTSYTDRTVDNYTVIIGNTSAATPQILVDNSTVNKLDEPPAGSYANVNWASTNGNSLAGQPVDLGSKTGSLQADIDLRGASSPYVSENYLNNLMTQVNTLAQGVANAVNTLHQTGQGLTAETTGINFFDNGTPSTPPALPSVTAANISLSSDISNNLGMIATGAIPSPSGTVNTGDGSVAAEIASLASGWTSLQTQIASGTFGAAGTNPVPAASLTDYYSSTVSQLGVDVQEATRMKSGEDVLVSNLSNQRQTVSGVSLDEEMTNLIQYQKSYSAAARMVTIMDDMLNTLVTGMGITR